MIYKTKYKKDDYIFEEVIKEKNISIFSQTCLVMNKIIAYEVYIIRNNNIPKTTDWGKYGFTFRSFEKAKNKFIELLDVK